MKKKTIFESRLILKKALKTSILGPHRNTALIRPFRQLKISCFESTCSIYLTSTRLWLCAFFAKHPLPLHQRASS